MKLRVSASGFSYEIELNDTPTAKALLEATPFQSRAQTWGEEVYFLHARERQVGVGCKAGGGAFPYGRTPISTDERPKLARRCNVVGALVGDPKAAARIKSGETLTVSRA